MFTTLPALKTTDAFDAWRHDRGNWEDLARRIARAAGFSGRDLTVFGDSTNLVLDVDGAAILKIFPPLYYPQFLSERAALHRLAGQLSVAIPRIIAADEQHGWSWLVMTKLDGVVGSAIWPQLSDPERALILHDVGRVMAEVHALPPDALSQIGTPWPAFIRAQVNGCVALHRAQGLAAPLLDDLATLAPQAVTLIPLQEPPVILTSDWIPQNFLLSAQSGDWRLCALIDFGDVRTGWWEYDLLAPSALMCDGNPALVQSLFDGYGTAAADNAMRRRLLILMALHHASDFRILTIPDWESRIASLYDLEQVIWPGA
ncbi:phosphotransferase family protein [Pararhodobacter zhoushanensis]|uniref:Aminoglycoside phosphotransferase family protein n=1 Tax=Pararhodobacter zhoushanensis TaxID=2479545 RepID=A0ABT3GUA8_9RHOB|nr:aminoglycoside phosphotransferase family protein [Pararhodobacter zhoushanensis]MCW1931120.1 aminoglycoside phosphotransferase family protein [Pararhodobacter zhoushanensis]